jgi:transcriptional regulator with XRE-family HTH domain
MSTPQILITSGNEQLAKERLAQLIRSLRGQATQREFAKQLGTSYTAVQDWEKQVRLPSDKNLKRIAELKGWTQEKLMRHIFCLDNQSEDVSSPLEIIIAQIGDLSPEQMELLINCLTAQLREIRNDKGEVMRGCLNRRQKHNLHLLLRASLKNHSPTAVIANTEIKPELFTDIFLRNDTNRVVTYEDLENLSGLCYQVIDWRGEQLPNIDRSKTYLNKTELLFNDLLTEENKAEID